MNAPSTVVLVTAYAQSRVLPLRVNGRLVEVPVGVATQIPTAFLPALRTSSAAFTIVETVEDAPEPDAVVNPDDTTAGGDKLPRDNDEPDYSELLKLLDLSVAKITAHLPGIGRSELDVLINAETDGKTRTSLIAALTAARDALPA